MATVVYQGLQSCLHESHHQHLVEPRTTLWLKLSSPKPHFTHHHHQTPELAFKSCFFSDSKTKNPIEQPDHQEKCHYEEISRKSNSLHDDNNNNYNHNKHISSSSSSSSSSTSSKPDLGHYSFLQALYPAVSETHKNLALETAKPYVHPLAIKRTLSEKSLELCTENLGSETGTNDIIENSIFSLSSSSSSAPSGSSPKSETSPRSQQQQQRQKQQEQQQQRSRQSWGASKKVRYPDFPPPLTTISGSESIQFRSHREDGRLIVEAVKSPPSPNIFQAERSHGRLRLSLFKASIFDVKEVTTDEANEATNELGFETEETNEEEEEEEENDADFDGDEIVVGESETGIEQNYHQRFGRRCKDVGECENKHDLLRWIEPFSVAIS